MTEERYQVPAVSKIDGWNEVPLWVMHGRAVPYPRNCFTLEDGTVVKPGEWIVKKSDKLEKAEA